MTEIKKIIRMEYEKAMFFSYLFLLAAALLIIPPVLYEYSLGFAHVQGLMRFGIASFYIILLWLSGFLFGVAISIQITTKKTRRMF